MVTGVVDQYVDASKFVIRFLEQIHASLCIRDVHRKNFDSRLVPQLFGDCLEFLLAAGHE